MAKDKTKDLIYQAVKKELLELKDNPDSEIIFRKHAEIQMQIRSIEKDKITSCIKNPEKLLGVDKQDGDTYKTWFKESNQYCLVPVIKLNNPKIYIITAYKTSKKWQTQAKKPRK
jgi:uncharacterized protein YprB with RNaseH-like and TPR domain